MTPRPYIKDAAADGLTRAEETRLSSAPIPYATLGVFQEKKMDSQGNLVSRSRPFLGLCLLALRVLAQPKQRLDDIP